jgi:DNA-binding response OmpR family regulator
MPTTTMRRPVPRRIHHGHTGRHSGPVHIHRLAGRILMNPRAARPQPSGPSAGAQILIAEANPGAGSVLEARVRADGYSTTTARTGAQALALARDDAVDLLILDVDLPGITAQHLLRTVRAAGVVMPIIVLGSTGAADAASFLESGADDFMAKPARIDEVLARMRARLRPTGSAGTTLIAGTISLDVLTRRCMIGTRHVELTAREFALAEVLVRHPAQVLSRQHLAAVVWGPEFDGGSNVVEVYVGYLRRKLGDDVIRTVRGVGYRLDA